MKMPLRTQYEERVLTCARKLARMKAHGTYIKNDSIVVLGFTERKECVDYFTKELVRAADELLNAMAIDEVDGKLVE